MAPKCVLHSKAEIRYSYDFPVTYYELLTRVMESIKEKQYATFTTLKESRGYSNMMQAPRIQKVVVNAGIGSYRENKDKVALVEDRLARITGQKPATRGARQSIASFKIREGDHVGYQVTLRGRRMNHFLDKLITIALPRMKDFRGISEKSVDEMGNYTLGIPEHTIFPETSDEELRNVFGFSITIVTTASSAEEARAFLTHLGLPFRSEST